MLWDWYQMIDRRVGLLFNLNIAIHIVASMITAGLLMEHLGELQQS